MVEVNPNRYLNNGGRFQSGENHPNYGKHLPEEIKRKISQSHIGLKPSEESIRKNSEWHKGRKASEETRKKMSEAFTGRKHSEESKKKMSKVQKVRKVSEESKRKNSEWHKGKPSAFKGRKHTKESIELMSKAHKGKLVGKKHPMYGKHHTEESKRKNAEAHKGKKHSEETKKKLSKIVTGRKHTAETRKKMSRIQKGSKKHNAESRRKISEAGKGRTAWNKGRTGVYSEETIRKISIARAKQKFPFKDSKPELLTQSILKKHNISFKKHYNLKFSKGNHQPDIIIEPNHIIEVFGDYWHFNPKKYDGESLQKKRRKEIKAKDVWKRDKYVIEEMEKQGYKVLVIWESELKTELEKTTEKILKFLK